MEPKTVAAKGETASFHGNKPPEPLPGLVGDCREFPRTDKPQHIRSGLEEQIIHTLEAVMLLEEPGGKRRTFDPIVRPSDGSGGWITRHKAMEPADVAALVLDPDWIGGIRHRHQTRLVVIDVDNKPGHRSPYWHPAGPDQSPVLQRLLSASEAAGCASTVFSTPSGGWHAWIVLPAAVHHSIAARIGLTLVRRAGMTIKAGDCEVFPNVTGWSSGTDAKTWSRCHGFRLPGQAGGAVWLGHGWSSEPEDCWAEAAAAAELSDGNVSDAWEKLLVEAASIRPHRPGAAAAVHRRPRREHGVQWNGPGESNGNLRGLANALYQAGEDRESFGRRIAAAARSAAGFDQFASDDTRQRLDQWALDWASCCIRRPPIGAVRQRSASADPGRNYRLHREAVVKVVNAALAVAREHGASALRWSERMAAEKIGMTRDTFRSLKALWRLRLTAAVYASRVTGIDPSTKGGDALCDEGAVISDRSLAAFSFDRIDLLPIPPPTPAFHRPHLPLSRAMPTAVARSSSPRRDHEREELARWLAAA